MTLRPELLAVLVCPRCKGDLRQSESPTGLICDSCRLRYPIRDGIPIMLPDEATAL